MDDARVWGSEEGLWTGDAENYDRTIDDECLMVLPRPPHVATGRQAKEQVIDTPRWTRVAFSEQSVSRPQEGLIVIAYRARAEREGANAYEAHCTTVYRRLEHDKWRVVQHQQSPVMVIR
jgi:hypothetical protein